MRNIHKSIWKRLFRSSHQSDAIQHIAKVTKEIIDPLSAIAVPLTFRGKGYFQSLELKQSPPEIFEFVKFLADRDLRKILEIGTFRGGTLYVWCQLLRDKAGAMVVSVDLPGGKFGGGYAVGSEDLFQAFCQHGQKLICLKGDSHSSGMVAKVAEELLGDQLDFLFIDGDHSFAGVKADFENYKRFVKKGGVIAFHDIVKRPSESGIQVDAFWESIKSDYEYYEFVGSPPYRSIGIGAIIV